MNTAKPLSRGVSIPHNTITWLLIAGFFFLRIILLGIVVAIIKKSPDWIYTTFEIGSYFLTFVLIWWERENLAEFFIDRLALIILILGKPYDLLLYLFKVPYTYSPRIGFYWLYLPIAFGLLIVVLFSRSKLNKLQARNWLWLLVGIVTGIVVGILLGYLLRYQYPGRAEKLIPFLIFFLPTVQLVRAGISEEPFFRGFLWGALRRAGWKDIWILLFQTVLFMLGHIYYFGVLPMSFWIVVPLGGFIFGVLAWRSRSIATSMAGHGFMNAIGQIVTFYRF